MEQYKDIGQQNRQKKEPRLPLVEQGAQASRLLKSSIEALLNTPKFTNAANPQFLSEIENRLQATKGVTEYKDDGYIFKIEYSRDIMSEELWVKKIPFKNGKRDTANWEAIRIYAFGDRQTYHSYAGGVDWHIIEANLLKDGVCDTAGAVEKVENFLVTNIIQRQAKIK